MTVISAIIGRGMSALICKATVFGIHAKDTIVGYLNHDPRISKTFDKDAWWSARESLQKDARAAQAQSMFAHPSVRRAALALQDN